jgi:hypothetical protein
MLLFVLPWWPFCIHIKNEKFCEVPSSKLALNTTQSINVVGKCCEFFNEKVEDYDHGVQESDCAVNSYARIFPYIFHIKPGFFRGGNLYLRLRRKCRTQFMLPMEMSVTFTGACANEIISSMNSSFVYKAKEGRIYILRHIRIEINHGSQNVF